MAACLGFSAAAQAPVQPRLKILVADRRYSSGRSILNIQQVMEALEERYSGIADIELRYMDGMTVRCAPLAGHGMRKPPCWAGRE